MSGAGGYNAPSLALPYAMPSGVPAVLQPIIKPLYTAFQNIIQIFITYCGISSRPPNALLSSINDPTAILSSNVHRFYTQAAEPIVYGAAVNLFDNGGGILAARNANATDYTKQAHGFCSQLSGLTVGQVGEIILNDGINPAFSGLTVGATYYLSTVSGGYTSTAPTAAGRLEQSLGFAISSTVLRFWTGTQIRH